MAQYKVPQDVEADDKLIGPFSFRQFVYLLIAAGLIALMVGLFQIFPLLAIIPLPMILLFLVLALPLKKDQPMETYLAALVSFYLKPHTRRWVPGQKESTILITAPKVVEEVRTRDISQEEATHRLSFLADIVDTEGYAIKNAPNNSMREDLLAEANAADDMFDNYKTANLNKAIVQDKAERHEEAIKGMREAISRSENNISNATIKKDHEPTVPEMILPTSSAQPAAQPTVSPTVAPEPAKDYSNVMVLPTQALASKAPELNSAKKDNATLVKPSIIELANNTDFTVATIAKQANRINRKDDGEVFISLH